MENKSNNPPLSPHIFLKYYTNKTLAYTNFYYLNYKISRNNLVRQVCQLRTKTRFVTYVYNCPFNNHDISTINNID